MLIRFGASDTPACPECNDIMRLTRRTPHPTRGYDFELQTFSCRACTHVIEREADILGELAGLPERRAAEGETPHGQRS